MEETFMQSMNFECLWKKTALPKEIESLVGQVAKCKFPSSYNCQV